MATVARAEPPRADALRMRSAPRSSTALPSPSRPEAAPALPAVTQPAASSHVESADTTKVLKEATEALELCFALARRADASLTAPLTVHAVVRADASVELRASATSLGNGYFARCVERKVGALVTVAQLPEPTAETRTLTIGAGAKASSAH